MNVRLGCCSDVVGCVQFQLSSVSVHVEPNDRPSDRTAEPISMLQMAGPLSGNLVIHVESVTTHRETMNDHLTMCLIIFHLCHNDDPFPSLVKTFSIKYQSRQY